MDMTETNIHELCGAALDWAVAQAIGQMIRVESYMTNPPKFCAMWKSAPGAAVDFSTPWMPSKNWAQLGPIIEEKKIDVWFKIDGQWGGLASGRKGTLTMLGSWSLNNQESSHRSRHAERLLPQDLGVEFPFRWVWLKNETR